MNENWTLNAGETRRVQPSFLTKAVSIESTSSSSNSGLVSAAVDDDDDAELDASQIGVKETYHRLWAVCQLPAVRTLFMILLTYRLPTALSDNVKFLKAVEYEMIHHCRFYFCLNIR